MDSSKDYVANLRQEKNDKGTDRDRLIDLQTTHRSLNCMKNFFTPPIPPIPHSSGQLNTVTIVLNICLKSNSNLMPF